MAVILSQKAAEDVCAALLSVFNTRSVIQMTSTELRPNANILFHFSAPDLSTRFIPSQLGSVVFCSAARRGLTHEVESACGTEPGYVWSPSLTGGEGGWCSCSWGSSAAVWPVLLSP